MTIEVGQIWRTRSGFDFEIVGRSAFTEHFYAAWLDDERVLWTINADGTLPNAHSNEHQLIKRVA